MIEQSNPKLELARRVIKPMISLPFGINITLADIISIGTGLCVKPVFERIEYEETIDEANCGGYIP